MAGAPSIHRGLSIDRVHVDVIVDFAIYAAIRGSSSGAVGSSEVSAAALAAIGSSVGAEGNSGALALVVALVSAIVELAVGAGRPRIMSCTLPV